MQLLTGNCCRKGKNIPEYRPTGLPAPVPKDRRARRLCRLDQCRKDYPRNNDIETEISGTLANFTVLAAVRSAIAKFDISRRWPNPALGGASFRESLDVQALRTPISRWLAPGLASHCLRVKSYARSSAPDTESILRSLPSFGATIVTDNRGLIGFVSHKRSFRRCLLFGHKALHGIWSLLSCLLPH